MNDSLSIQITSVSDESDFLVNGKELTSSLNVHLDVSGTMEPHTISPFALLEDDQIVDALFYGIRLPSNPTTYGYDSALNVISIPIAVETFNPDTKPSDPKPDDVEEHGSDGSEGEDDGKVTI